MSHVGRLYINRNEEHLNDLTTYKNLNSDPAEVIRNYAFFTFDCPSHHTRNRSQDK